MTRFRRAFGASLAIAAVVALTACASTPSAVSTPTGSPTATPTPAPEPALARIVVLAETVTALDSAGDVMASFTYFDPAAATVGTFTDLLGFEPTVERTESSSDFAGLTAYQWDGLTLTEAEAGKLPPYMGTLSVMLSASHVRGVALEGPEGIKTGDAFEPLVVRFPDSIDEWTATGTDVSYRAVQAGSVRTPSEPGAAIPGDYVTRVRVTMREPDSLVFSIVAPVTSFIPR